MAKYSETLPNNLNLDVEYGCQVPIFISSTTYQTVTYSVIEVINGSGVEFYIFCYRKLCRLGNLNMDRALLNNLKVILSA